MELDRLQGLDLGERIMKAARLAVAVHQFQSVQMMLRRPEDGLAAEGGRLDDIRFWQRPRTGGAGSCASGW